MKIGLKIKWNTSNSMEEIWKHYYQRRRLCMDVEYSEWMKTLKD